MRKLISAGELRKLAGNGKQVTISSDCVLSPSALDLAKELEVEIVRENSVSQLLSNKNSDRQVEKSTATGNPIPTASSSEQTIAADDLKQLVKKVLADVLQPACPNPRVTYVSGGGVALEHFEDAPPGQNVKMKDVVTARDGNLCAGFMAFDHSKLPWHLTYDEVDYVVEGVFTLKAGEKTYTCRAGDVLYIPKNTHVVFGSPETAKVFYVTYPANWADLK